MPEFLYQVIFVSEGTKAPERDIISDQDIRVYIKDFRSQPGDLGVVAEKNRHIVGAVWTLIIQGYDSVDQNTP